MQLVDTAIKDDCVKEIAYALKSNKNIKNVDVSSNLFNPKYLHDLKRFTKENQIYEYQA